jgi:hypothetical protein
MKYSLKTLSFIFDLAFISSSLNAQQLTTVIRKRIYGEGLDTCPLYGFLKIRR